MTKLMQALLFGVGARDVMTFVLTPMLFAAIALVACYVPARRATSVQPIKALKGA